ALTTIIDDLEAWCDERGIKKVSELIGAVRDDDMETDTLVAASAGVCAARMTCRYEEIGQRLKACRMGSGLGADEIARKIGISRTALYRFERCELTMMDTLAKFAELLGVSTATLLGVGIEYIPSAVSYFERMRQIEETAEQIVILSGPISFL